MRFPFVSIVIPVKEINDYIREAVPKHLALDYPGFEVLILPDNPPEADGGRFDSEVRVIPTYPATGPADKRDIGAREAKGEILAFIDDDAYPWKDWLKNAVGYFEDSEVAAVCGPGVTPPGDSVLQRAGGWVSASLLGGGPEASYRFFPRERREVDDYPSMNFLTRRSDFEAVGGFDSHFWPGEDTKLCLDLTKKLGKKIIYAPEVLVYHHRRPLFIPHLKQNGRYGLHRGHFARILPETSHRLSYFIPSLFTLFLFGVPVFNFLISLISASGASKFPGSNFPISRFPISAPEGSEFLGFSVSSIQYPVSCIYVATLAVYCTLLLATAAWVYKNERNWKVSLLVIPGIFATHLWYGLRFIQGFLSRRLKQ